MWRLSATFRHCAQRVVGGTSHTSSIQTGSSTEKDEAEKAPAEQREWEELKSDNEWLAGSEKLVRPPQKRLPSVVKTHRRTGESDGLGGQLFSIVRAHFLSSADISRSVLPTGGGDLPLAPFCPVRQARTVSTAATAQQSGPSTSGETPRERLVSFADSSSSSSSSGSSGVPSNTNAGMETTESKDPFTRKVGALVRAENQFERVIGERMSAEDNSRGLYFVRQRLFPEALQYFRRAVTRPGAHPRAEYNLGMCYYKGYGTRVDLDKAVFWWERAAEHGHATAYYQLGVAAYKGLGSVAKELADVYIATAAKHGVPEAKKYTGVRTVGDGDLPSTSSTKRSRTEPNLRRSGGTELSKFFRSGDSTDSGSSDEEKGAPAPVRRSSQHETTEESIIFADEEEFEDGSPPNLLLLPRKPVSNIHRSRTCPSLGSIL